MECSCFWLVAGIGTKIDGVMSGWGGGGTMNLYTYLHAYIYSFIHSFIHIHAYIRVDTFFEYVRIQICVCMYLYTYVCRTYDA